MNHIDVHPKKATVASHKTVTDSTRPNGRNLPTLCTILSLTVSE